MTVPPNRVFHPAEGALLDLESLMALAQAPSRLLSAWAELSFGAQGGGLVLSGLEIEGTLADLASPGRALGAAASPGVVRAKLRDDRKVTLSPGVALVWTREGQHQLVRVPEPRCFTSHTRRCRASRRRISASKAGCPGDQTRRRSCAQLTPSGSGIAKGRYTGCSPASGT